MRLLFIVNTDWFFITHRLPIAIAAQKQGYEVHIAVGESKRKETLIRNNIKVHVIKMDRKSINPLKFLVSFFEVYNLIYKVKPDLLHLITIKPVILGGLACRLLKPLPVVASITGLGYIFSNKGLMNKIKRYFVQIFYKIIFLNKNLIAIFQNKDDQEVLMKITSLKRKDTVILKGSGVDLKKYKYTPVNTSIPKILFASRLLISKGIMEFIHASEYVREAKFIIAGQMDIGNPESITDDQLKIALKGKNVDYIGFKENISEIISDSTIFVLPSYYGEGFPKVLAEAAACGRPVITTDNVGCRDAIIQGETGLLVPVKNIDRLVLAIKYLLERPHLIKLMGRNARNLAEKEYDIKLIVEAHLKIYAKISNFSGIR